MSVVFHHRTTNSKHVFKGSKLVFELCVYKLCYFLFFFQSFSRTYMLCIPFYSTELNCKLARCFLRVCDGRLRINRDDISFSYIKRVDKNYRLESKAFKKRSLIFFIHIWSVKKKLV